MKLIRYIFECLTEIKYLLKQLLCPEHVWLIFYDDKTQGDKHICKRCVKII